MACRRKARRGYSLIEVLVVLSIIAILSLVVSSRIGNSYTQAVVSLTDQVEATLYAAQRTTTTTLSMVDVTLTGGWDKKDFRLTYTGAAPADEFRYSVKQPDFQRACVDPASEDKWPSSLGTKPTFAGAGGSEISTALDHPLLAIGKTVSITAARKEFSRPCFIAIVPVQSSGKPLYSGPAGLVVMQGHMIYKYVRSGSGQPWRRA